MKVKSITCSKCGYTVYSRARHDMRYCSCGENSIDGGLDYIRIGFKDRPPVVKKIDIGNITKEMLYKDWNQKKNQYGLIKK